MLIRNVHGMQFNLEDIGTIWIDDKARLHFPSSEQIAEIIKSNPNIEQITLDTPLALFPGWIDTHIHGYHGVDFSDADLTVDKLHRLTEALGATGLAYCMATLVSLPDERIQHALKTINAFVEEQEKNGPRAGATKIIGIHLEGPYLAHSCKGAHDQEFLRSTVDASEIIAWLKLAPRVTEWKMTIAPELKGAIASITTLKEYMNSNPLLSIQFAIGHSNAIAEYIQAAILAGANCFTHLGNANCETASRLPRVDTSDLTSNVVNWVTNPNNHNKPFCVELICDGYHLSKAFVRHIDIAYPNASLLVTDALGASGLPDGRYQLGTLAVDKKGERFTLADSEKLAGSAASYAKIVETYATFRSEEGIPLWKKLQHATIFNPRRVALHEKTRLNDETAFLLLDAKGILVLSAHHGKIHKHTASPQRGNLITAK